MRDEDKTREQLVEDLAELRHRIATFEAAEDKRQHVEEWLDIFAQAVQQSPTPVTVTDINGTIEYVNPAFTQVTGYTSDEVVGQNPRLLSSGKHPPEFYKQMWNTILAGKSWQGEVCNRKKNGELYYELQSISPIKDAQGAITHFVATRTDQTEYRRAEKQRLELELEKEKIELLKGLLGDVTHDFRTHLSVLNTSLYLLERVDDPEKRKEKLEVLTLTTGRLEKLVNDLQVMAHLDRGTGLNLSTVDLNKTIRDIDREIHLLAEQKALELTLILNESIPSIVADEDKLYRALTNLIDNAVHYTPLNGIVVIHTYTQEESVIIEVLDTGIGIAQAELPRIFDRFYRTDKARSTSHGGSGLGLAIVKGVVELHGGKVEVESAPGKGSTFRVWLPVDRSQPDSRPFPDYSNSQLQ